MTREAFSRRDGSVRATARELRGFVAMTEVAEVGASLRHGVIGAVMAEGAFPGGERPVLDIQKERGTAFMRIMALRAIRALHLDPTMRLREGAVLEAVALPAELIQWSGQERWTSGTMNIVADLAVLLGGRHVRLPPSRCRVRAVNPLE